MKKDDMELPGALHENDGEERLERGGRALMTKGRERERVGMRLHLGRQR